MQQLIPMTEEQEQSVESVLKKINMQNYLAQFQMIVNGTANPAAILSLLGVAYNIGYSDADEAGKGKLRAIQSHIHGPGSEGN